MKCAFIYNGRSGPKGMVCGRPESEHCGEKYGEHPCLPGMVHHTFTRKRCGCTETHKERA